MKCVLLVSILCFPVVIANTASQCERPNTSCFSKDVCALLGGKAQGNCFKGVCCEKPQRRSGNCNSKTTSCVPKMYCPSKRLNTNHTCKGKGQVCCNIRKKNVCRLFGGTCEPTKVQCHVLRNVSTLCGKRKKCCVYMK
uniref:Carboxypeptidase inhibitor n=1 Tax=Rhipicephalus zambeziensis TaxID=60191 RepID=A0A224YDG9_9ACAR